MNNEQQRVRFFQLQLEGLGLILVNYIGNDLYRRITRLHNFRLVGRNEPPAVVVMKDQKTLK
ncbi:hypothetical protein [Methylophaga sp.]|uniref:hypothetical protein n=1 Tax=Methylophaga sp. TaxID=2024840 RepID=UPI0027281CA0|nr:hypothetical protein [Methylophaga sp.]MDO8827160.1 hypothetical protein [Methylophaga sp.]